MRTALALLAISAGLAEVAEASDPHFLDGKLPRRAVLGAAVAEASEGVKITAVIPGKPAALAGLRADDIVTSIGTVPIHSVAEFLSSVKTQTAGHPIPFSILRDRVAQTVSVVLATIQDENDPLVTTRYTAIEFDRGLRRVLLTSPKNSKDRHPALLIIGGIGCYTVDNAADTEDAYARIAHDLSRRGFLVARLEKSGVGDSQGAACLTVDLKSEIESYATALEALRHDPRVSSDHLYLLGHSIGTLEAPRIAAQHAVSGVVIAEGVGRNWFEYELLNLRRQFELAGEDPRSTDDKMRRKERCMHRLLIAKEDERQIEAIEPACAESNAYPASAAYMQQAAEMNIVEPWTRLSVPLFAIYGTADFVTTSEDHQRIVDIVNHQHPGLASLKLIQGMDHHLETAGSVQDAYDGRVKQSRRFPYEAQFSIAVADWLCQRERCARERP
jgi:pimeloyl-ACP methyl ester carboxylesterase